MRTCRCRSGWRRWGRQCYRAVTARLSWTVASRRCRQLEPTAYLTSIKSGSENDFVFGFLRRYPFWIGFSDRAHEGHFACDSGEECRWYSRWHPPTEPNGVRHREDCAEMLQDRTWADNSCHLGYRAPAFPSVCEYSICGRSKTIPLETVRGTKIRLWQPDVLLRRLPRACTSRQFSAVHDTHVHDTPCMARTCMARRAWHARRRLHIGPVTLFRHRASTDGLRCPPGWRRSDSRCYGGFTAPDTFARVERQCASRHPQATVAVLRSIENNDVAVFAAGSLPMWIDYGRRSGGVVLSGTGQRKQWTSAFTYWEADAEPSPSSKTDCAGPPVRRAGSRLKDTVTVWYAGGCRGRRPPLSVRETAATWPASRSQDENGLIATLAFRRGTDFRKRINRHAWIGAARAHPTDAWTWDDCDAWTMTRWMHVDDSKHTKGVCSAIHCNGRWRQDANCETSMFGSVCELDPCLKNFGPTVPVRSGCRKGKVTEVGSGSWPESQTCL
ncbi:uncharacterized protein LOC119104715 [Pollicipes pollicipes]|uniref:uncharacterized protein LOC119104715 n=1 Tax=Pollicipes pollicipes TaxID=41117 RepID=UPI001884CA11|nr:uncharacterized protein LOC119104715 [Pollicipes pollicipes]